MLALLTPLNAARLVTDELGVGPMTSDEAPTAAILDRLLHKANVLDIQGRSCRLRDLDGALGNQRSWPLLPPTGVRKCSRRLIAQDWASLDRPKLCGMPSPARGRPELPSLLDIANSNARPSTSPWNVAQHGARVRPNRRRPACCRSIARPAIGSSQTSSLRRAHRALTKLAEVCALRRRVLAELQHDGVTGHDNPAVSGPCRHSSLRAVHAQPVRRR